MDDYNSDFEFDSPPKEIGRKEEVKGKKEI